MELIFADMDLPKCIKKSIFLAGPSPRTKGVYDWRHDALKNLEELNFTGTVFIPIPKNRFYNFEQDSKDWTYDNQILWECQARELSDIILFWVARDIQGGMPAFTTNIEFGEDLHSGKIVYGRPDDAEKCRYLDKRIEDLKQPVFSDLNLLLTHCMDKLGEGSLRTNGETHVPLFIWKTEQFQSWYKTLISTGNRLESAKLLHHFAVNDFVFSYVLAVNIWIEAEKRFKSNEFIFTRKDTSTIVPFYRNGNDIEILLVKEFRSPVNNNESYVYELPGGSSFKPNVDPRINAQHELHEETGLFIENIHRFNFIGDRQLLATLSTHKTYVYSIELNENEYLELKQSILSNKTFGVESDSEKTYIQFVSLKELKTVPIDYSMLGIILETTLL